MPVSKRRKPKAIPPRQAAPKPQLSEAEALHAQGLQALQAGKIGKAFDLVLKAIQLNGRVALYHYNIGNILHAAGRTDEAIKAFSNAIALDPSYADSYVNLGLMLALKGRWNEAIEQYRKSIVLNPEGFLAPNNLGIALMETGKPTEAEETFRRVLALKPDFAEAYNNLGIVLKRQGRAEEAIEAYRQALTVEPHYVQAYVNLGNALRELNRPGEAREPFQKAIALRPDFPEAHYNFGCALFQSRKLDEAEAALSRAIALRPDYAEPHLTHAILSLLRGAFKDGWEEYEWRWRTKNARPLNAQAPAWDGGPLAGKTILLAAEQGLGDALQFIRYAALVKAQAAPARILFHCPAPLAPLFRQIAVLDEVIPIGQPIPPHDCYALLMSLPLLCGTTSEAAIPHQVPYLKADPAKAEAWKEKMETREEGPRKRRIGLLWAGNPRKDVPDANSVDKRRSMRLAQFAPLAGIENVHFYSLQKDGDAAQEAANPPPGMDLIDLMPDVADFADTAALIANLDLVIGVDTSVIHLAGAMGKPVWVLSRHDGCWRWLLNREDNPWYPTLRLFRQEKAGEWGETVERVRKALGKYLLSC